MRIKVPLYAVKGILCALPISLALAVLVLGGVRLYVEHVTYPAYLETAEIGIGSVGTAPLEDTPRPTSLAEIRQYDRFAPVVLHYKAAERVGGRQYYILTLPSGETVIGHMTGSTDITPAGTTESGEPLYQLPIARWDTVEVPQGEQGFGAGLYDDDTHFVECAGEKPMTVGDLMEQNSLYRFFSWAFALLFLVLYAVFATHFRRRAAAKTAKQQGRQ